MIKDMRRKWTEKEVSYMENFYLKQPVKKTARTLNRSEISVKRKATKMKLNHYTDFLTAKAVARSFNSDVEVVLRWVKKFKLPARKVICDNQTRYLIDSELFWKWAFENKAEINWSKYNIGSIIPEPNWVKNEKLNYKTPMSRKKITLQEKAAIKNLLRKGKSYREISDEIGRTYNGVNKICGSIYK